MVWVVLLIVLVVGALAVAQALERRPRRPSEEERRLNALRVLEYRYVRGEIDEQELERRRRALGGK
jgi:uncharacterized membrane protein